MRVTCEGRWYDGFAALFEDEIVEAVGVIGAVCQNLIGPQALNQTAGRRHVVLLAGTEFEPDRQAKSIDYGVELGAEPATGATQSLGLRSPLFRRAPAAWAWARITVASSESHSMSGSVPTASKILSNTPISIQR